jgi:hypothetical protein
MTQRNLCECGHPAEAHEHYRPGSDCGFCGPDRCPGYRAAPPAQRTRRRQVVAA